MSNNLTEQIKAKQKRRNLIISGLAVALLTIIAFYYWQSSQTKNAKRSPGNRFDRNLEISDDFCQIMVGRQANRPQGNRSQDNQKSDFFDKATEFCQDGHLSESEKAELETLREERTKNQPANPSSSPRQENQT